MSEFAVVGDVGGVVVADFAVEGAGFTAGVACAGGEGGVGAGEEGTFGLDEFVLDVPEASCAGVGLLLFEWFV